MIRKHVADWIHTNLRLFAFLPWLTFWGQNAAITTDQFELMVGIGFIHHGKVDCQRIIKPFKVRLVRSAESRSHGLSHRSEPLKPDEGMLFLFESPQLVNFWMKDTLIPLEIVFFDNKAQIIGIQEMSVEADPTNPVKVYSSRSAVLAALEVPPKSFKDIQHGALCAQKIPRSQ